MAKLLETKDYSAETIDDLKCLIQILKDCSYPLIELADIISIVLMIEYILADEKSMEIYKDFIRLSIDTIGYILADKTYIKIEDKIIFLEYEFYTNICKNPKAFEDRYINELKKSIAISKNKV